MWAGVVGYGVRYTREVQSSVTSPYAYSCKTDSITSQHFKWSTKYNLVYPQVSFTFCILYWMKLLLLSFRQVVLDPPCIAGQDIFAFAFLRTLLTDRRDCLFQYYISWRDRLLIIPDHNFLYWSLDEYLCCGYWLLKTFISLIYMLIRITVHWIANY